MARKDSKDWGSQESEEVTEITPVTVPVEVLQSKPKIPFEHWFNNKLKAGAVRFYQDDTVLIFFKEQGLTALEDEDEYEKAFKKF